MNVFAFWFEVSLVIDFLVIFEENKRRRFAHGLVMGVSWCWREMNKNSKSKGKEATKRGFSAKPELKFTFCFRKNTFIFGEGKTVVYFEITL